MANSLETVLFLSTLFYYSHKTADILKKSKFFETAAAAAKSLQSCPTLCDPIDGSPPGSAVPGISQARTLEWVAIAFSIFETSNLQNNVYKYHNKLSK